MSNILENLPAKFIDNMHKLLGERFDDYVFAMNQECVRGFRINPLKISVEDFEQNFSAFQNFESSRMLTDVQDELITVMIDEIVDQIYNKTVANW